MVSDFVGFVCLARADDVGAYCLPDSWPGRASVERSNASGYSPHGGRLYRYAHIDTDTRADASLTLGFRE